MRTAGLMTFQGHPNQNRKNKLLLSFGSNLEPKVLEWEGVSPVNLNPNLAEMCRDLESSFQMEYLLDISIPHSCT